MRTTALLAFTCCVLASQMTMASEPVEAGAVKWSRDLASAQQASAKSGKPVLILFQEVPG